MRIAIIGAGSAGLAALKNCSELKNEDGSSYTIKCFEKTDKIGGTWIYTPQTGVDRFGLPIHSSMYKNLRTNLPKEVMGYPDYPIPEIGKSYLTRSEIVDFLNSYCDNFQLRKFISFLHNVELVEPINDEKNGNIQKWRIRVKNLSNQVVIEEIFDAVMVCNGHYFQPSIPEIKGNDTFLGGKMHSHDYRVPDVFKDKSVVILGAGPSGMDLALEISSVAKKVILSHHLKDPVLTKFPNNVIQKPDVLEFKKDKAIFNDNSEEKIDFIFYCTGYKFSFPFLSKTCGVKVESNMVTPLWKHLIAVENPSLAFIGLPFYVCAFSMFDLQVRFTLKYWRKEKQLPSKAEMLAEENREREEKLSLGFRTKQFHQMGPKQGEYYQDLAETAEIKPLPSVLTKLHNDSSKRFLDDLVNYRRDRYKILDDDNFVQLESLPA